jgi:hypothetical protein
MSYVAAKAYRGWCYGLVGIELGGSDARRLGIPIRELARVALAGDGIYWNSDGVGSLHLSPTSKLLTDFPAGLIPGVERPILDRITDRLKARRYEVVRDHCDRAHGYYNAVTPDLPNAVKEATVAVASLALKVLGLTSGTFGDCIKELRRRGMHRRL